MVSVKVVWFFFFLVVCSPWFYVMALFRSLLGHKTLMHKRCFCSGLEGCVHGNREFWRFLGSTCLEGWEASRQQ